MEDENEYQKLPTEEKCVHKLWKARQQGYEEAIKLFNQIEDEKSPEWNKYLGLIKKFVTDSNAVAQEKGLEAALVFVENCGHAGKTTGEVMSGIVSKCIAAPKTKTKDLALQITLMYVEIEKQDAVQEELMKGMEQKNPKVVAASTAALTTALKLFGNKVIGIKPMVKKIPILLADRDKGVRDEMKALVVEMHRWIGPAIEPHIASLQAVVQQELRQGFTSEGTAQPARYLRSQQHRAAQIETEAVDGATEDEDGETGAGDSNDLDPFDLLDPVEILSKLPKDFYEKIEAKKWQERKEALDALEGLLKSAPRLEPGDYADLVRALKKVISKDSNVILVALAGRLLGQVASGLRNRFQPYAVACIQAILEKFKEKKANVVTALRDASDVIYPCTNLEAISEDMLAAFENKNPSIKAESCMFLARSLCKTQPAAFNKKLIKLYVAALLKLLESADPTVRDAAAEALGTASKLVGEKAIAPHIGKIDNLKEQKIKEAADRAVIQVKVSAPKKEVKAKAASGKGDTKSSAAPVKPARRPAGSSKKAVASKKPASSNNSPPREPDLSPEEVDAKAEVLVPADVLQGLADGNWKSRQSAVQSYHSLVQSLSPDDATAQLLFKILNKKPGLKDTNVQVLKAKFEVVEYIAENFTISNAAVDSVLLDCVSRLGEASCAALIARCLTALCARAGLHAVCADSLSFAVNGQKNPKVLSELLNWICAAVKMFGFTMNIKTLIPDLKKCLSATNPNVRTSAVNLIGILSLYVGPSLINHFDGEKPATKQLISLEIDKYANSSPPTPTRQVEKISKSASKGSVGDEIEEEEADLPPVAEDARAKTDIAPLITDALIAEINDKNWKVRNEALEKLKNIIANSGPIKPTLGELPPALTGRLLDSNAKLAQMSLQICESLAVAMGAKSAQHVRTFLPPVLQAFGDNKQYMRTAAISCADTWLRLAGSKTLLEGEMLHDALSGNAPVLNAALWTWLLNVLPEVQPKSFNREELVICLPQLYAALEERSAEVRRAAADCVLPFMLHLGYETMLKAIDKVKPGSKAVIQAALDKARPNLPVQPLPSSKGKKEESKGVKTGGATKKEQEKKAPAIKGKGAAKPSSAVGRGKKDDEDNSPLLPNNNAKHQRAIDDQKLKVLKWNFTTPREEFFDLLKEQMTTAGLNKQLVANMFHTDFRYHLKAIESLSEDLQDNGAALTANLDLVLKWLTLRFFDTNPSVILKGLEYLSVVFTYLIECDYTMLEYEANCFIPYLVIKVGDPKDTVRNGVKALFKQICVVYSVTKLFGYLMEGLKSKNARQRAECLDCIGHLLETYGSSVISGSNVAALKELARHIGDRDNAVRSSALNCVCNAYFLEGEKIYKMIGQISDKDLSLLEERIKRASKSRSAEQFRAALVPLSAQGRPLQPPPEVCTPPAEAELSKRIISVEAVPGVDYEDEECEDEIPQREPPPPAEPCLPSGPFGLDPVLIAQLDAAVPRVTRAVLPAPDLRFLDEPVPRPVSYRHKHNAIIPMTPPRQIAPPTMTSHLTTPSYQQPAAYQLNATYQNPPSYQQSNVDDSQLADTIHSIASPDVNAAIRALSLISGALVSGRGAALAAHEDRLITAIASQVQRLRTSPDTNVDTYKYLAGTLTAFYESSGCGSRVGEAALCKLLGELLRVLGGDTGGGAGGERLVRILNNVCVRLLEHSPPTHTLCAIITLLHESIGQSDPEYPRYQDLLLKCFWKSLKMISNWDVDSIDYDSVLYKIHLFYKAYPNSYWKNNPKNQDTPYRTVKTLVHTLVKLKGRGITDHLSKIPDINESEIYPYLLKVFKQLKLDEKKENTPEANNANKTYSQQNQQKLPRDVHENLAAILNKIANKHQNKDALIQLYDLRERHPEVDIWTYMQGSSFYFRNYVERGLRDVAEQRRETQLSAYSLAARTHHMDINNENEEKSHVIFLERLRALQAKAGLKSDTGLNIPARSPTDNRAVCDTINENLPRPAFDPRLEINTAPSISHRNEADMDALRLKLQQIKSSSKR